MQNSLLTQGVPGSRLDQSRTIIIRLLSFSAQITTTDQDILQGLHDAYTCSSFESSDSEIVMQLAVTDLEGQTYRIYKGSQVVDTLRSRTEALGCLENLIDAAAITSLSRYLIIHAGVVASGADGIVIPGSRRAGKSTLVTALSLSGFNYLSDELAIMDPNMLTLHPYCKGVCLKSGGWRVLYEAYTLSNTSVTAVRPNGDHVRFMALPHNQPAEYEPRVRYVLVPKRERNATTTLLPITRSEALAELAKHSLNLPQHGRCGFEALARVVEGAECFVITYDALSDAVNAVAQLTKKDFRTQLGYPYLPDQ